MGFGKWIGGALGWAVGGPIGGLLGFAFGTIIDDKSLSVDKGSQKRAGYDPRYDRRYQNQRHHTQPGDFASALLVLSAAVMKADGKHMKSELDYIRGFFTRQFGESSAAYQMSLLKELLQKDIPVREVCEQIRYYMEHPMRLQMMHYLFGIANSDGAVDSSEERIINQIAHNLGISQKDYESIRAMFYHDAESDFKILEIESSASDEEVKKAYRKMAMKYHPDKVRGLGEQHEKAAAEKFVKVQEAYERIKKKRNIK
ncbi:MAG: TerB family tellurite resistance protein [Flavobacteriales bacterium]|jgi:DnaJ like chaperone protein